MKKTTLYALLSLALALTIAAPAQAAEPREASGFLYRILHAGEAHRRQSDTRQTSAAAAAGLSVATSSGATSTPPSATPPAPIILPPASATTTPATSTPAVSTAQAPTTPLSNGAGQFTGGVSALGQQNSKPYGGIYASEGMPRQTTQMLLTFSLALGALGFLLVERRSLSALLASASAPRRSL